MRSKVYDTLKYNKEELFEMQFQDIIARAIEVRKKYEQLEVQQCGRKWNALEQTLGLVTDIGELAELVQAKAGIRDRGDKIDDRLAHELSDCLWSIIVLSKELDIDLEQSFLNTMNELDIRLAA